MSAFLCSNEHINALVTFAKRERILPYMRQIGSEMTPQEAAQLLYDENVRSLVARYGGRYEDHAATEIINNHAGPFEYVPDHKPRKAIEIIKLCHCYDYQACESEDYETTKAHELIERIERAAIRKLPGYDAAPWGI